MFEHYSIAKKLKDNVYSLKNNFSKMPEMNRLKYNLILLLLIPLMLIAPDFLAQIFNDSDQARLSGKFIIGISIFAVCLSFSPRPFVFFILSIFICLELIQFCHLFYYGSLITSAKIKLLFYEFDEVWLVTKEAVSFLYLVPLLVLIPYSILILFFNKFEHKRLKSYWTIILVLICTSTIPYRVHQAYYGTNYYPDPSDHSLRNSLYAFTNCMANLIYTLPAPQNNYKDYQVESIPHWQGDNVNVILIIGESVNYHHMSLFGYQRDTNPLLSLLKNDPNFTYLKGLSSGVSTPVTLPTLLNSIYEPNNMKALEKKDANLFRLAKQHNFKTFYVSAQSGAFLTHLGAEFIDYKMFYSKAPLLFNQYQDEALLKIIPDLDYTKQNFIVINQRNAHAPYKENYAHNPSFNFFSTDVGNYQDFLINSYDNAMRYNDYLINEIIKFYRQKFTGPTYIFFTSDHGEVLERDNIAFGHATLDRQVAEIPFIAYRQNAPIIDFKNIKEPINHYEISQIIAQLLGFKIHNPNQNPGVFYINGPELDGHNELIEYHK